MAAALGRTQARTLASTPLQDGFHMPGEFERHAGTWMLWPERPDNWRLGAAPAQQAFTAVAAAIARFEPVTVGASPAQFLNACQALPPAVRVVEIASDDAWMRDVGPTFVVAPRRGAARRRVRGVDWDFNAWGGIVDGLYACWEQDALVARKVLEIERLERYHAPLVLEGGSIHSDGQGTLLTTEECLLSPGRNPQLSKAQIEAALRQYTGAQAVLWLPRGVFNDETNGHVDNLACFLRPGVAALTWTEDRLDPQYERSVEAYDFLSSCVDACGRRLQVVKLHQPDPVVISAQDAAGVQAAQGTLPRQAGDRLAASYVNFYFCNRGAIVPVFDDPHDAAALQTLQELLPGHRIVPIPAREILLGGGNIHCITQQQPV